MGFSGGIYNGVKINFINDEELAKKYFKDPEYQNDWIAVYSDEVSMDRGIKSILNNGGDGQFSQVDIYTGYNKMYIGVYKKFTKKIKETQIPSIPELYMVEEQHWMDNELLDGTDTTFNVRSEDYPLMKQEVHVYGHSMRTSDNVLIETEFEVEVTPVWVTTVNQNEDRLDQLERDIQRVQYEIDLARRIRFYIKNVLKYKVA